MNLEVVLGIAAAVVLLGVIAVRASVRLGLPSLLLYLGIGILLGESVVGLEFSNAPLTESLGLAALVLILVEGGLTTRWSAVRPSLGVGIALSTVAVVVSIAVVGVSLHLLLGLEWRTAFLWGAVLSSTDAAAVFSVLRGVGVSPRLAGALELESGMNDAPVVLAVILLASTDPITWLSPLLVVYELGAGAVIGGLLGIRRRVGAAPCRAALHGPVPARRDRGVRPGLLGGPARPRLRAARHLRRGTGAGQLRPAAPRRGPVVRGGDGLAGPDRAVRAARPLRLAARGSSTRWGPPWSPGSCCSSWRAPLSVIAAATPFRVPWREQAFLSWAGLRGAVPIVLALIALIEGAPEAQALVDVVFVLVVLLTLLQGTTLPRVARLLGVARTAEPRELEVDAAPLDELGADLLQVRVPVGSQLRGVYLRELRLPRGATVSLVVRGDEAFTPTAETRLRERDQLLVVTTADARRATEERIRAVDHRGRLARWHGGRDPQAG